MLDDFLCNRRRQAHERILKPVRKPEILEMFDMDEETEEYFAKAILEDLWESRNALGILGWWPIDELRERIRHDTRFARRLLIACSGLVAAGVAAFTAFVLPRLPWIGPRLETLFTACWATLGR